MKLTIKVLKSDDENRTSNRGSVARALHRTLLSRFPDLDHVHEGITELGFTVGEDKYECRYTNELKGKVDWINYGQGVDFPQKLALQFVKL